MSAAPAPHRLGHRCVDRHRPGDRAGARPGGLRSRHRRPRSGFSERGRRAAAAAGPQGASRSRSTCGPRPALRRRSRRLPRALGTIDVLVNNAGVPLQRAATRSDLVRVGRGHRRQSQGQLFPRHRLRPALPRQRTRRRGGQHGVDPRPHGHRRPFGLRHLEGRHHPDDAHAGDRMGAARHSGQRGRAGDRADTVTREACSAIPRRGRACWRASRSAVSSPPEEVAGARALPRRRRRPRR